VAIVSVDEIKGARSGSIDAQWHRTYKRAWRVVTEHPLDIGPLGARLAIPIFFGQYYTLYNGLTLVEFDEFAFALKIDAVIDPGCNDDCSWIVTVEYGPYDPTQFGENPLNHPLKITWGENRFETPLIQDIAGLPVVNSAGDYFDPPPMIDDSRPTLRIVRNEPTYDPGYAALWKDSLNANPFFGYPPLTVKSSTPLGELEFNPVCGFYYVVTYQFEINLNGWQKLILDQGTRQIVGGVKANIVDDQGTQITAPAMLNGVGRKLATGGIPIPLVFNAYQIQDYSQLNLDPTLAPGQG